jgi:hypothetical protein
MLKSSLELVPRLIEDQRLTFKDTVSSGDRLSSIYCSFFRLAKALSALYAFRSCNRSYISHEPPP